MPKRIRKKSLSELDLRSLTDLVLTAEEQQKFTKGIALFNAERFWEAHEVWEEIWQNHPEDGRVFIQALIQLAAGYHQLRRKIYRGFVTHLSRAQEKLNLFPPDFLGINVAALLEVIQASLQATDSSQHLAALDLSRIQVPKIENLTA